MEELIMSMILEAGEVCKVSNCPYNSGSCLTGTCYGARPDRDTTFTCEYVVNGKLLTDFGFRNAQDKTGKMKVIME
jgi:hypothetical protein